MGGVVGNIATGGLSSVGGFLGKKGDKNASDWQSQYDSYNMVKPELAGYMSPVDSNGNLKEGYQLAGPQAYTDAANAQQGAAEGQARDQSAAQGASAQAQARAQLASHGGLRGGAAQRLAVMGQRDQGQRGQDVTMQGIQNRAQIGLQGAQMGRDTDKYNLETRLKGMQGQNEYNMNKYMQDMQAYAGGKQAQGALEQNKGKGQKGGIMGGVGSVLGK